MVTCWTKDFRHINNWGTLQGGVISPLLSNIYLCWFTTTASFSAKAAGSYYSRMAHYGIYRLAWVRITRRLI